MAVSVTLAGFCAALLDLDRVMHDRGVLAIILGVACFVVLLNPTPRGEP